MTELEKKDFSTRIFLCVVFVFPHIFSGWAKQFILQGTLAGILPPHYIILIIMGHN